MADTTPRATPSGSRGPGPRGRRTRTSVARAALVARHDQVDAVDNRIDGGYLEKRFTAVNW